VQTYHVNIAGSNPYTAIDPQEVNAKWDKVSAQTRETAGGGEVVGDAVATTTRGRGEMTPSGWSTLGKEGRGEGGKEKELI
jgi:hypothetical protein